MNRHVRILLLALWAMLFLSVASEKGVAQEEDSTDEESTAWTAAVHALYSSRDNTGGVDMSNELAAFQYGAQIEHSSGFSFGVAAENLLGSGGGFVKWGATLGYAYTTLSWMNLSGEFSYFKYEDDSLNAIANLTNSLTLGISFPNRIVSVGFTYNSYFGGGSASYYGFNLDRSYSKGDFTANPSLNFSFISQTIDQKRLVSYKRNVHAAAAAGKGKGFGGGGNTVTTSSSNSVTVTGLSGITLSAALSYDLGNGLSVNAQPSYVYSPKAELAAYTNQFLWSLGVTYSRDF